MGGGGGGYGRGEGVVVMDVVGGWQPTGLLSACNQSPTQALCACLQRAAAAHAEAQRGAWPGSSPSGAQPAHRLICWGTRLPSSEGCTGRSPASCRTGWPITSGWPSSPVATCGGGGGGGSTGGLVNSGQRTWSVPPHGWWRQPAGAASVLGCARLLPASAATVCANRWKCERTTAPHPSHPPPMHKHPHLLRGEVQRRIARRQAPQALAKRHLHFDPLAVPLGAALPFLHLQHSSALQSGQRRRSA